MVEFIIAGFLSGFIGGILGAFIWSTYVDARIKNAPLPHQQITKLAQAIGSDVHDINNRLEALEDAKP